MPTEKMDDETSLPRATVDKLIQELLPKQSTITKETRDALRESCHQFLNLIACEANKICEIENKKTITNQHVFKALEKFGFSSFVEACAISASDYEDYSRHKPSKQDKFKESGKTMDELHEDQMKLFDQAKKEVNLRYGVEDDENSGCAEE